MCDGECFVLVCECVFAYVYAHACVRSYVHACVCT